MPERFKWVCFQGLSIAVLVAAVGIALPVAARRSERVNRSKGLRIYADAALFVTENGRRVLFARNASRVKSIASLSKLMAMLVVVERHLKLMGVTTLSKVDRRVASGGSRSRLKLGGKYLNNDLLHAALMASDNSAVSALGRAVGLSPAELVSVMNRRARLMGLRHTRFMDPVGIHTGNVSTAFEVALMLRAAAANPTLGKVMRKAEHYARAVWPSNHRVNYLNTNLLVHRSGFEVLGGKTGFNHKAGYCLATAVKLRPFGRVLAVILDSRSKLHRFRDFHTIARYLKNGSK